MNFVKCFDVVEMVTDEATEQFGSLLRVDVERRYRLKNYCEMVDSIAEQFGGASYEVKVDDETTDITISLVCDEFETDTMSSSFYKLARETKKMGFKACGEEQIQIDFTFDGIWVRAL